MKVVRAKIGPFKNRPYYEHREIEEICENELKCMGLYPTAPGPVRIDRFVEKRFAVTPEYFDLPKGVLGFTEFGKNGVTNMFLAKSLDTDHSIHTERRLRTTIAHEAGHGLLHSHLYAMDEEALLFEIQEIPKIMCREEDVSPSSFRTGTRQYDDRWWEYQANRAMGALLMPLKLVKEFLEPMLIETGSMGTKVIPVNQRSKMIEELSTCFDVNPIVSRLRLEEWFFGNQDQLSL